MQWSTTPVSYLLKSSNRGKRCRPASPRPSARSFHLRCVLEGSFFIRLRLPYPQRRLLPTLSNSLVAPDHFPAVNLATGTYLLLCHHGAYTLSCFWAEPHEVLILIWWALSLIRLSWSNVSRNKAQEKLQTFPAVPAVRLRSLAQTLIMVSDSKSRANRQYTEANIS